MPFSRSSTWTASVISLDIRSYLQQIAAVDVGVRDRYDPVVGGDGDLRVARADELPGEAPAPALLLARAYARAATDVAAEVIGLRQRPLRAGRRDLEAGLLQQVAQVTGYALARRQRDAVGGVDDESHGARVRRLEQQDLDVGLDVLEAVLYVGLCGRHHVTRSILDEKKVGCEAHLQVRREAADESPSDCSV